MSLFGIVKGFVDIGDGQISCPWSGQIMYSLHGARVSLTNVVEPATVSLLLDGLVAAMGVQLTGDAAMSGTS